MHSRPYGRRRGALCSMHKTSFRFCKKSNVVKMENSDTNHLYCKTAGIKGWLKLLSRNILGFDGEFIFLFLVFHDSL